MARLSKVISGTFILAPLFLWAVLNWFHTFRDVKRYYVASPVWDYFFLTMFHLPRYKAADLSVFWVQQNEHRIVFPEIFFAIDSLWLHARMLLPLAVSSALYFGIWLVMIYAIRQAAGLAFVPRYAAVFLSGIMMAWLGAAYPLATPLLLQWTMNQLAAILALAFLQTRFTALFIAAAVICNYSSGNGLLIWWLLLALALLLHTSGRFIAVTAINGAISTTVYFFHYKSTVPIDWQNFFGHPLVLAKFLAAFLSMPFGALRSEPDFAFRIGFISLAALLVLFVGAWRARLLATPTSVILFGYAAYVIASGLLAALGRMNIHDPVLIAAKADRYLTLPLTYWATLAAAAIWIIAQIRMIGTILAIFVSFALCGLIFRLSSKPGAAAFKHYIDENYATQQWAALALESGVVDPQTDPLLFPDLQFVPQVLPAMRSGKLALFSQPDPFWIGRSLAEVFPEAHTPTHEEGAILTSKKLQTTIAYVGWATTCGEPCEILLVDENHRIVGVGRTLPAGIPAAFGTLVIRRPYPWFAFANLSYGSQTASVFEVSADRRTVSKLPIVSVDLH